jgi:tetratricopeptide (TPR) repeat protein
MILVKFAFGLIFFFLGWIYFFKSNLVLSLNKLVRDYFFDDRLVLLKRKKLAILFFCLSFVALYMGFSSLSQWMGKRDPNNWAMETNRYLMYMAMQDYCTERYDNAIEKYRRVLAAEPNNTEAWKRLAYTYMALGDKKKARMIWKQLLRMAPGTGALPQHDHHKQFEK